MWELLLSAVLALTTAPGGAPTAAPCRCLTDTGSRPSRRYGLVVSASASLRGRTAILRFGRDEDVERATAVARFDANRPPFVLMNR